ncbi:hypothetical protein GC169_09235 [bacterium]|nr:hypothetical protein [bacterium]
MSPGAASSDFTSFETRDALALGVADEIGRRVLLHLADHPRAALALAGGTTPGPVYRVLGRGYLPWDRIDATLTDERWVAPDGPDANEHMLRTTLLHEAERHGRGLGLRLHPFLSDVATPVAAANAAEPRIAALRPFAATVVGFGLDGHVASLFPGALPHPPADEGRTVIAVEAPSDSGAAATNQRLSLTLPALLDTRGIWLVFTGADKLKRFETARDCADGSPLAALLAQTSTPVHARYAD